MHKKYTFENDNMKVVFKGRTDDPFYVNRRKKGTGDWRERRSGCEPKVRKGRLGAEREALLFAVRVAGPRRRDGPTSFATALFVVTIKYGAKTQCVRGVFI